MKLHHYPETDSLYFALLGESGSDSREGTPGVVLGLGGEGPLVGIDVDQASAKVDLSRLEGEGSPLRTVSVGHS